MNRRFYIIPIVAAYATLAACSPKLAGRKKNKQTAEVVADTTTKAVMPPAVTTTIPVATPGNAALIEEVMPLWRKRLDYKTLSGKAKIALEGPDLSHELVANYRIAKDSVIWVHVTALGGIVSVARIFVTADSFYMLNYQQKEATKLALKDVGKILPVPVRFRQLQSLFTGEPLADGEVTAATAKDSSWALHTEDAAYRQDLTYMRRDSTLAIGNLETYDANGPKAMVSYNLYQMISGRSLSTNRTVHIQNGVKNYTIEMNLVNPEFDKALEYPFSIPGNYKMK